MLHTEVPEMNIDEAADPALAAPLAALRAAMQAHDAPPAVEDALMAAFAARFPPKRWYHALSPRQWSMGLGSTTLVAAMALVLTLQAPATLDAGAGLSIRSVDEGSPFIALESLERIEQEANPRMLEADVPRTALASLGLPVSPENAGDSVRAEMLVGADGSPLALRLVSP
jgi:hypothetical protein